ncbi:Cell wall-associated polypeptide CWBP200 [Porphyromonas macacae]|uniref:Cell wall-associated polypeptide CWBP200 n=3 Tax=Porphyromonas macacae TaxID=28115 RepID=A0A379E7Y9_9PORP|nr:DUF6531 domain-containing protein [Porphyromonas macacae]SUB88431.1 Cell wall-associated polypeptide CWBP200 [Porphyromonas macacae]
MAELFDKVLTAPVFRKGFGELFGEAKDKLDHLQRDLAGALLPSMPGMPVAKYYDLAIGIDFHETIFPPSPLFPVPHIGMVFDIMGAIMSAISTVLPPPPAVPAGETPPTSLSSICTAIVNGMKPSVQVHGRWVANAGTGIQHLPGIFAHLPFPIVKPMASSEMFMGSSTVLADGGPCSTQFHPALSCNLIGIPAPFRANKPPGKKISLMAPTSMLLIITSAGAPVLVGGPPTIDLFQLAMKLGMKGMGKLWGKVGDKFQDLIDGIKTKHPKLGAILQPVKCRLFGEPVDAVTGRVYCTNRDVELAGPLPFVWERTYYSDAEVDGPLGYNWHHNYNMGLYDMGNGLATIRLWDGRETIVPLVAEGERFVSRREGLVFTRDAGGFLLRDRDKRLYRFNGPRNRSDYSLLSSVETAEGFALRLSYSPGGVLRSITDSVGRVIEVETDTGGRVLCLHTSVAGKRSDLIRYVYDEAGNMVESTDRQEAVKRFRYEGHLLVRLTNQTGQNFYWAYEGRGDAARCVHTWGDGGVLEHHTEYKAGHTSTRNSLGFTTDYFYDGRNLIYKIVDEAGGVTLQEYNEYEELVVTVDPEGQSRKYTYNESGEVICFENGNGERTHYEYDERGNLLSVTTPRGAKTAWEYDERDRVCKRILPEGQTLCYEYEGLDLSRVTDERGHVFDFLFDREHRPIQLTYPNGSVHQWRYDAWGHLGEECDVRGNHTFYRSDEAGNLLWMREPDGNEHHFSYDTSGNLIHARDQLREVSFRYGSLGTLLSRTQNGRTVRFEYDTELRLTGISNEGGEFYRFALDGRGDVVDEWGFDGLHRHYERDGAGRVRRVLRPDDRWSAYEYDGVGHIVGERHSDGSVAAYKYDKDGLLTAAFNDSMKIGFERGRDGRVLKEIQGEHTVESVYDAFGSRTRLLSDRGADVALRYDSEGFLSGMQTSGWSVAIGRDRSGLEIQRELSGGVSVTTGRDMLGRTVRRDILSGGVEQSRMRYRWSMGNRLHRKENELTGESVHFGYDSWDNLFRADYRGGSEVESIYKAPDALGNLFRTEERKDRKYGKGGRLLEDRKFAYRYDGEGNLVLKSRLRPDDGDEAPQWQEGDWAYEWQGNGMLKSVKRPDGEVVSFEYDPLGRRISKRYKGTTTRWVWDGNVPLHEWTDEEKREGAGDENLITWLFEEGSFVPTAKIVGNKSYSIITDYLGTPTHAFDSKGDKIWKRELDIYGKAREGDSSFIPFLFQGQYFDAETDLCYNRFRYYSPDTGSYISQDPIGLAGGNPTLYGYVFDSNTEIDPFGLECGPRKVKTGEEIAPNTTVKRIKQGTNGKSIIIGRNMDDRVIPAAKNIGAEYWTGFAPNLADDINLANNKKWLTEKISEGYTVIDVGLDPKYVKLGGKGSKTKGKFYSMETKVAFGKKW